MHVYGNDDAGILRALCLVDGHGVGVLQLVELIVSVDDRPPIKFQHGLTLFVVQPGDPPDVAVPNLFFVVVHGLDDLVAGTKSDSVANNLFGRRIQCFL